MLKIEHLSKNYGNKNKVTILWRKYFWNWRENDAETFAKETVA